MIDREKVINELVEHIESALAVDSDYVDYVRTDLLQYTVALLKEQGEKMEHLNNITLEYEKEVFRLQTLLKEQEAVEPTLIREGRNKYYSYYVCPRCDNEVVYDQNYCSECGVQFLWEGR